MLVMTMTRKIALALSAVTFAAAAAILALAWQYGMGQGPTFTSSPSMGLPSRDMASFREKAPPSPLVSLDELQLNVDSKAAAKELHWLSLRIDLELFEQGGKEIIERRHAGIKNAVIEAVRDQSLEQLQTLPGKLYFKEVLVSRINAFLNSAVVRDVHFANFLLK